MRLLLDEQLSPAIAEQLQQRGHDAVSVAEAELRGHADAALLIWASSQKRAIVTNNIGDFRPLHASYLTTAAAHYGTVLLPSTKFSLRLDAVGMIVAALDRFLAAHSSAEACVGQEIFL